MTDQETPLPRGSRESKQGGLFSSLSLGRASKSPKPSETLTHPLLGASSSTLNLATTDEANNPGHSRSGSGTLSASGVGGSTNGSSGDVPNPLPYKPRQRHAHQGSTSSVSSLTAGGNAPSPTLHPTSSATILTSPVTPTTVIAPATTSTSTSTTFALPPLTTDTPSSDPSSTAGSSSSATATVRLQQQSLKAAAQRIGLGNGSMGMTMLDAIFDKGQIGRAKPGEGGDWGDVLRTLIAGKVSLAGTFRIVQHVSYSPARSVLTSPGGVAPAHDALVVPSNDASNPAGPHCIPVAPDSCLRATRRVAKVQHQQSLREGQGRSTRHRHHGGHHVGPGWRAERVGHHLVHWYPR
jgi:hypothetical protein